ncbi:LamB/YcsF family protein [Microbacterium sp. YY-01]|uniref:LamB/YcsF family protein n=1 Tax=Microbacterium sp. YY-01 TaxID=3421634 RepID=UPI003D18143F
MRVIDLNADLGENSPERIVSDDAAMLRVVSSANVSCGAHAGTPDGIRATLSAAVAAGVAIGAHPSYDDYANFGRIARDVAPAILQAQIENQLAALQTLARAEDAVVRYVKPHGALYNTIAHNEQQAKAVIAAVRATNRNLPILGLAASPLLHWIEAAGLTAVGEVFADRAYTPNGQLVPRSEPGAVIHDPVRIVQRMLQFAEDGVLTSLSGAPLRVPAASVCVHGDTADAVTIATLVRQGLESAGVTIAPFATHAPGGGG